MADSAESSFHESMERLAGGLGVTFEGVSRDWVAGLDPVAPANPPGPQILTADGWRALAPLAQAASRRAASDSAAEDGEA